MISNVTVDNNNSLVYPPLDPPRRYPQTEAHVHFSGYAPSDLQPLVDLLFRLVTAPQRHPAICEKYSDKKFQSVSLFVAKNLAKNQAEMAKAVAAMGASS